ncbi:MAG: VOC family protein [Phycisphaeraceae bacterium]|nr:VOC family protein [Phycisphaerae bacterium]MBX3393553.1 VOC family protein [Phycisphaeraceae bacterium]
MPGTLADKVEMQNRLFSELSRMFAEEVPLYDKSLAVNFICNRAVCDLLAVLHPGFSVSDELLRRTSSERHGAIRIGRPDEYRLMARFFACFGMEPHNFYDMTVIGARSQPVIATAFRSVYRPGHRVFTSLLMTDYFDGSTRARIEGLLASRRVFSDEAIALLDRHDRDGGLSREDADALIREATGRVFKWTGRARDHRLYQELCGAGFKIAADIACFERHHLNHLTPNTLCMDLYTAAMKYAMGESDRAVFERRAARALNRLLAMSGPDWLALHFKPLSRAQVDGLGEAAIGEAPVTPVVKGVADRLSEPAFGLSRWPHAGFKDFTEGPASDTPVLLRQDAYKALTEPVVFREADGGEVASQHTARFGEIEQRFYATTPAGRALYDRCQAAFEESRAADPGLATRDEEAFERLQAVAFAAFPKTLDELLARDLVFAVYEPTPAGRAARGTLDTTDMHELVRLGHVRREGQRYEDFLPVSAAGIFASNLNQYGTASTAAVRPEYSREQLERIMGKRIVDADAVYRGMDARSRLETFEALDLLHRLPQNDRRRLEHDAQAGKVA